MTDRRPIACDLSGAADTPQQRAAAYRRLFAGVFERDRSARMLRFRFLRSTLDEALLHELVERERACCPFFDLRVHASGNEVWWETTVEPDPAAEAMLAELSSLPERVLDDDAAARRLIDRGLLIAPARDEVDREGPAVS